MFAAPLPPSADACPLWWGPLAHHGARSSVVTSSGIEQYLVLFPSLHRLLVGHLLQRFVLVSCQGWSLLGQGVMEDFCSNTSFMRTSQGQVSGLAIYTLSRARILAILKNSEVLQKKKKVWKTICRNRRFSASNTNKRYTASSGCPTFLSFFFCLNIGHYFIQLYLYQHCPNDKIIKDNTPNVDNTYITINIDISGGKH